MDINQIHIFPIKSLYVLRNKLHFRSPYDKRLYHGQLLRILVYERCLLNKQYMHFEIKSIFWMCMIRITAFIFAPYYFILFYVSDNISTHHRLFMRQEINLTNLVNWYIFSRGKGCTHKNQNIHGLIMEIENIEYEATLKGLNTLKGS